MRETLEWLRLSSEGGYTSNWGMFEFYLVEHIRTITLSVYCNDHEIGAHDLQTNSMKEAKYSSIAIIGTILQKYRSQVNALVQEWIDVNELD